LETLSPDYRGACADDPMPRASGFRTSLASIWFRLMSLGIVGLVFAEALFLAPGKVQNWSYYLAGWEVVFEVVVRLISAALAGMALGTVCTLVLAPFLWHFSASRDRFVDWATKIAVVLVVFPVSRYALTTLIKWSNRGVRFTSALLVAHFLAFAIALLIPRSRKEVVGSLDGFLGEKMSRRMALATVGGAAALAVTEFAFGKTRRRVKAALAAVRPKSNFLLITFDALGAEDMSLYGYRLPTTPNIDAFAGKGTVFTNFYSASTFTTPSVATLLTGLYPSETQVYQLQARMQAKYAEKSLPHMMRAGGYATGAFLSNPFAYHFVDTLKDEYDSLPEPTFQPGGLRQVWDATAPLHQDSGIGNRIDEYNSLEWVWNFPEHLDLSMRLRAVSSFDEARKILAELPAGFFLWVHVMTPNNPYLPDAGDRGLFLPHEEQEHAEDENESRWKPHYEPDQQSQVDRRRLVYDEFILSADRAFGAFIKELEDRGRLRDTTVIVSADHGESFEGRVFEHESPYQTRPVIHIPLIIRTPGQQESRKVGFTADQASLAPTILDLAGQPKPDSMRGPSLVGWLNQRGQGEGEGMAFTQYFERNSVYRPLRHGTVGVIDGRSQHQYVLDIETQKGSLRPLNEAEHWKLDRTAENPALAEALRAAIFAKFPELPQKPS
jgi:arylsulfatase A-like enzyme